MQVLIVGGGGREHALAWKIAASPRVERAFVAPGNAGTAAEPKVENVAIAADAIDELKAFALEKKIDLTVIGPEAPLVAGIVDAFSNAGLRCFGPTSAAAQLEGSKAFAKAFMQRHDIPSASSETFDRIEPALDYIGRQSQPPVVKADGLAGGKGVVVSETFAEAEQAARNMLAEQTFGAAGNKIVIEHRLRGEEASFMVLAGPRGYTELATSQDHKALNEGDTGPNTGGMGAYSPAPVINDQVRARILSKIIEPVLKGLRDENISYTGFLYAGLMITPEGEPKVLEFNVRLGDPETQPIMMRLQSDLADLIINVMDDRVEPGQAQWDKRSSLGVVMASSGYPGEYKKDMPITGFDPPEPENTKVFHAGTAQRDDQIVTAGGRVLCVCALGDTISDAQQRVYQRVRTLDWSGVYYREDIGHRALAREA